MKNVFRLFGRFTMVMMIIGMVTLTSCEKEEIEDKPNDVTNGGNEIGNPEDFYPYTDKIIVESTIESSSDEYINMETFSRYGSIRKNDRKLVFKSKKTIIDTVTVEHIMWYMARYSEFETSSNITVEVNLIFFKNNDIFKEFFEKKETKQEAFVRLRGDSIKEIYNKI